MKNDVHPMLFEGLQKFGFRIKAHCLETESIVTETRSGRLNVVIEDADVRVELGAHISPTLSSG